jgi:hypothetical protein
MRRNFSSKDDLMFSRFGFGAALLLAAALLWMPRPAAAQNYPCPGGPGPGEVQVGVSGGSHGVAAVPICAPAAGGGGGGASAPSYSYGAIALHPDVDDVWMFGNWTGPNAAEQEALTACNQAMGGGCISIGEWHNSSMSIIRDAQGNRYAGWNGQGGTMRKKMLADCKAIQMLPCEVVGSFSSSKRRHTPNLATARKSYAAGAWVRGEGYNGRLYIASAHRTMAEAKAAATAACTNATGRNCEIAVAVANGTLLTFQLGYPERTDTSVVAERTVKRAQQAAETDCKNRKARCAIQTAYDSGTPGVTVHDFDAAAKSR